MMLTFKKKISLFAFAALAFMTACSGADRVGSAGDVKGRSTPADEAPAKPPSPFPPMPSGLAQSEFELLDGGTFKLSDKKGKLLVINIWATWCGPCRAEMPHLVALQDKYRDRDLEVVGLNIGKYEGAPETVEEITEFAGKMKLNYTLARSARPSTQQFYNVTKKTVVPQTMITDRDLHIRTILVGGGPTIYASMEQAVEKILNEEKQGT